MVNDYDDFFINNEELSITKALNDSLNGIFNSNNYFKIERKKLGRKLKYRKIEGNEGEHNKYSEDNMIRKIKCFFWKSIYNYLKDIFFDDGDLLKLDDNFNVNLKRDFNIKLLNQTLKNIFIKVKISYKFFNKDPETNIKSINRLYKDGTNKKAIGFLNKTYREAFDIFIKKIKSGIIIEPKNKKEVKGFQDIEAFIYTLYEKEKKNGEKEEDIKRYIDKIIYLCLNFENWFIKKHSRNTHFGYGFHNIINFD